MGVNGRAGGSLSWHGEGAAASVVRARRSAGRSAGSALRLPLIAAGSALLYALKGGAPRISGSIARKEKAAVHRTLRRRLAALVAEGTAFRLSSVLPFTWCSVHVVAAMEDARAVLSHLDADAADRLGSDRSDVLVIVRAPDALVRIDFGADYSLVAADPAGLSGTDVLVSMIRIAGVRHLHLAAAVPP
jgi:hypothetical protein